MTEEVKKEETKPVETKQEEVKEVKEAKEEAVKLMSPFISKDDIIKCKIGYYLEQDGAGFMVEGVHDNFNEKLAKDSFEVTFRFPTQKDANIISMRVGGNTSTETEYGIFSSFSKMEYTRMLVLITEWTLPKPCTEESIEQLHPSFIKGITTALREKIGMDAIV